MTALSVTKFRTGTFHSKRITMVSSFISHGSETTPFNRIYRVQNNLLPIVVNILYYVLIWAPSQQNFSTDSDVNANAATVIVLVVAEEIREVDEALDRLMVKFARGACRGYPLV